MAHAAVRLQVEEPEQFPRSATIYGIRELGRRAGASEQFIQSWRLEFETPGFVDVYIQAGTRKRIRFPRGDEKFWETVRKGRFKTSVAKWMREPVNSCALVSDFRIPFSTSERRELGPLFEISNRDCAECAVDLPASLVLTTGRFEETLPHACDQHGRFSAFSSIAWREGFLHRPIVDEYGLAVEQALQDLLPGWQTAERKLRVKLGHDVDEIGIPFSPRTTAGHVLRRGRPTTAIREIVAALSATETSYQLQLRRMVKLAVDRDLDCGVYWKASPAGRHDRGYDLCDPRIAKMIAEFHESGAEMGIHPGYETFGAPERFHGEVSVVRKALGEQKVGGRQDFLRWNPKTWELWESEGLAYDATVGFADQIGFRAGTCYPYRPWLFSQEREAQLLEIPLVAMDTTLHSYMKLPPEEALQKLRECVARCRSVGGLFTVLWHNTKMLDRGYAGIYETLLNELAGSDRYEWRSSCNGSN